MLLVSLVLAQAIAPCAHLQQPAPNQHVVGDIYLANPVPNELKRGECGVMGDAPFPLLPGELALLQLVAVNQSTAPDAKAGAECVAR